MTLAGPQISTMTTTSTYDVLVVGAGHAGAQTALGLRQRKFAGSVALIGAEPDWPYERPPLSKDYLAREKEFERLLIRPADSWTDRDVEVVRGTRVVKVEPAAHTVETDAGAVLAYRKLIWAAGGEPRRLSCAGDELNGVHVVRTRADVDLLMRELEGGAKLGLFSDGEKRGDAYLSGPLAPDTNRVLGSVGIGIRWRWLNLDLGYLVAFLLKRTSTDPNLIATYDSFGQVISGTATIRLPDLWDRPLPSERKH